MHKTNQTQNFKRPPGDLHRWRPASLCTLSVLIILAYMCRRLIRGCLLLRLLIILIIILLFRLLLFIFLINYSDESIRKLRA